nr:MAG TPA: hypothetical protein [Caudoviricetes sp.]
MLVVIGRFGVVACFATTERWGLSPLSGMLIAYVDSYTILSLSIQPSS